MTCFVTGTELRARRERPSDTFFTDMYDLTKGDRDASPTVDGCRCLLQDLIKRKPDLVIRSDHSRMPRAIHVELNDGVVNTVRQVVDPDDLSQVGGFVVASMVATLAWVPGGLGTFEGTCVAMLHVHGVAIEAALAATLLARGFTFWLPMAPGLAIARREMVRGAASAGPTAGAETP